MRLNLRIATILPLIVAALTLMGVATAGVTAWRALGRRQDAQRFLKVDQISQLLLRSAGQWAIERGITNAALKSPDLLSSERRAEIAKAREAADQALREAAPRLRALEAMNGASASITEAERALTEFEITRRGVDKDLARPGAQRNLAVVDEFAPAITNLIEVGASKLRLTLETVTTPPTAALAQLVSLRHLTAQMAENAGRERAFLGGVIGARARLSADGIRRVSGYRGHVELAWQTISPIIQRADTPVEITDAIAKAEKEYFATYGALRDAVLAAGANGEYQISSGDYVARATTAINSLLRVADAIGHAADREAASEQASTTLYLIVNAMVLLASICLAALSFWIALSRIVRPLSALTGAMGELADGNFDVALPGLGRKDEIGAMAQAVGTFKIKAQQKARDEAQAKSEQDRVAAELRKAEMIRLADSFESAVGQIVQTVSSASAQLETSAGSLTSTANRSQELTTMVAAASEQASANVQSVASATEELASSVNEIGRQVQQSARMANEAVVQARQTNQRVGELSKAAARIGDVIELIDTIAGQTKLLALNATIEAARAGEAGRGFAVVAAEVKALAEQTAKATGDIGQQISGIQAATQESVGAIGEIGAVIEKLSEIASTIAAAVEEQGAATQEISRNVQQAAQGTMQVSSNIGDVQRGACETGSASNQLLSSAQMLSGDSARLKVEVDRFVTTVRAA